MALARMLFMLLAVQTLVYVCVFAYLRARQRDRLEAEMSSAAGDSERRAFVGARLKVYSARMGRWLAAFVYGLPLVGVVLVVITTNFA